MKNPGKKAFTIFLIAATVAGLVSCKKMLDIKPEDQLDISQAYLTIGDADAAVLGVYGKFTGLAKQYVVLNELRADLMEVTDNADPYLKQLSSHNVTADNPYADPKPFYEVILNCNDVLKHLNTMFKESRISLTDYNQRYSDIGCLRSWLYLQLGIQYGTIPYITEPIENVNQINNIANTPRIGFNVLLDSLLNYTSALPYISEGYTYPTGSTLVVTTDNIPTRKVFINKVILLGELNLWKGNFTAAARNYRIAMEMETNNDAAGGLDKNQSYRIGGRDPEYGPITVFYTRGQEESSLQYSATAGWGSLFSLPSSNRGWNWEWFWSIPYSAAYLPGNPFLELFSQQYGRYMLKPSKLAIDAWNSQTQINGIPYDARGIMSYSKGTATAPTSPMITKYTNANPVLTTLNRGGQWNIWRAAGVHLHFSEAANRDGKGKLAWALLDSGIADTYSPGRVGRLALNGRAGEATTLAQLDAMRTPDGPPYDFDARAAKGITGVWQQNIGIRSRANLPNLSTSLQTNMLGLEDALINEAGLEMAFEGQRWADLMRISIRRNDPNFLADKVFAKLQKEGNADAAKVRAKLASKDWYLPFKW